MRMNFGGIYPRTQSARGDLALRAGCVLLGIAALLTLAVIPTDVLARGPTICVWKNLYGIDCPTCGMTRAFSSVLHGNFTHAFGYNKLVVVFFPVYCGLLLREAARLVRRLHPAVSR